MKDLLVSRTETWLTETALPLWLERGFDPRRGVFHEALDHDLAPVGGPVRAMVQARQIFSFRTALDADLVPMARAARAVTDATRFLLDQCRNENGSYALFIHPDHGITTARPELYTQAFVLFGLAHAYALAPMPEYRRRALDLLDHLRAHRAGPAGGFTEVDAAGAVIYRSNPLMHLFEAALEWMRIDPKDRQWADLGRELCDLAVNRLIDRETGLMPENFAADWRPERENGRFVWEPGHQFEWAWLIGNYERLTGLEIPRVRHALYDLGTRHGLKNGVAVDQVWSDFEIKSASARFWPQAERVKSATLMNDRGSADEALEALFGYLDQPRPGLWCDVIAADGAKDRRPAKASSLYHILGAMTEYLDFARRSPSPGLAAED